MAGDERRPRRDGLDVAGDRRVVAEDVGVDVVGASPQSTARPAGRAHDGGRSLLADARTPTYRTVWKRGGGTGQTGPRPEATRLSLGAATSAVTIFPNAAPMNDYADREIDDVALE